MDLRLLFQILICRKQKLVITDFVFPQVKIPRSVIHHYDISILPDKCPRRVNRWVGVSCDMSAERYGNAIYKNADYIYKNTNAIFDEVHWRCFGKWNVI